MKKALILHGTSSNSQDNWFPWLEAELTARGYLVWTPDLPGAEKPNIQRYNKYLLSNTDWKFDTETIIVGHSSGAVAILGLLQALPEDTTVGACYLVGSFKDNLNMESLQDLFLEPFDYEIIKTKSRRWYFLHSDNDPYCPLEHAEYLHKSIGGDLLVLPNQKHFSVSTSGESYRQFPYLLQLIAGDSMTEVAVVELYTAFEKMGITIWIDGGWGVDALLEKQSRPHGDLDLVIQEKDLPILLTFLQHKGCSRIQRSDETAWNFVLGDTEAKFIDLHVINLDEQGNGSYGPVENGVAYQAEALTGQGKIRELPVRCISPKWMVKFHTGYELRSSDYHDVKALCEKFGIELPQEYR